MENKPKWTDELKKLPGWISGAITFVTATIGFVLLIQGNYQVSIMVLVLLAFSTLFIILVYVAFAKTPPLLEGGRGVYRYQKYRPMAFIGMGIMSASLLGAMILWNNRVSPPSQQVLVDQPTISNPGATLQSNDTKNTPVPQPDSTTTSENISSIVTATTVAESIELPNPLAILELLQSFTSQNRNTVQSVSFSPDGNLVAAGFYSDPVHIWRISDGTLLHRLEGRSDNTLSIAFSSDGNLLATGSRDSTVKLWDVSDGTFLRTLEGGRNSIYSVTFSKDNTLITAGSSDLVSIWQVSDGTLLQTMTTDFAGYAVAISTDKKMLAVGGNDLQAQLWDINSGTIIHELPTNDWVRGLAFSNDGDLLAVGEGNRISMWRTSDGSKNYDDLTGHAQPVKSIVFLNDEWLATVSMDLAIRFWQIDDGQRLRTIEGYSDTIQIQHLSSDGKKLIISPDKETVEVWRVP